MKTATAFNRIIRRVLSRHAAWIPILTPFSLGDYGFYEAGVFRRLGNVQDMGVEFGTKPGGTARLDFQTSAAASVKFYVEGEGRVPNLPATNAKARIEYEYGRARSFLLKAPTLHSTNVDDIAGLARDAARHPNWRRRYKIVTELLVAQEATLVSTATRNTTVVASGQADLLRQFDVGEAAGGVTISADKSLHLRIVGEQGPCALGLVTVRRGGQVALEGLTRGVTDDGLMAAYDPEPIDEDYEIDDDF